MRWLVWCCVLGGVACTRMNPSYGDPEVGASDQGADDDLSDASAEGITDATASVGEEAEASGEDTASHETGVGDSAGETGSPQSCCARHAERGCEEPQIEACVCDGAPACCEIEWSDDCVQKARIHCNADCGALDDGNLDDGNLDGGDTMIEEGTSDSFGTSGTSSTATSDEEGGSTGPFSNACCGAQVGAGCGDSEIEECVCVTQGLASCCTELWQNQCGLAVAECGVECI